MQRRRLSRLLPVFAIAIGVALVAVTSAFKEQPKSKSGQTLYTFEYSGGDYSQASVEDVGNWDFTSNNDPCISGVAKACKIYASHVDASGDEPVLDSSENIVAAYNSATQTYRVGSTADGTGSAYISNKPN
ncbi:hypothetical protein [Arachidicoccus ginsenosidimutans]|uniref:hypothetical protein n=1 Tax=Arachidicoccus sp. BS20 TaxID=1850526 RepID=UPI0012E76BEA|nr:hypothetical protein [Arachidicoccus sp. BS20]